MFLLSFFFLIPLLQVITGTFPKWPPTYQMNTSTIIMVCNYSNYMSKDVLPKLARYGIVDVDWSNAKMLWSNVSPMNCQEDLLTQAQYIKAINNKTKVFVYRNLAKALPWFTDVREKLLDPSYNEYWFLKFKPDPPYNVEPCTNNSYGDKCSTFYHDQLQTPHHPSQCINECDCGKGLPCGEYLFDHRNESLREWLTYTFILGSNDSNSTGLNNIAIDGFYIDDGWSNKQDAIQPWMPSTGFCDTYNTFGGVTEVDYKCVQDMGINASIVNDIYNGWKESMELAQSTIVEYNGFNWQLFRGVSSPNSTECTNWMRNTGMYLNNSALMYNYKGLNDTQDEFEIDLTMFLLVRGPYAWLGYGWNGCHNDWEYEWNDMLDKDYGMPLNHMNEIETGVFQRKWSNVIVQMDCNKYKPTLNFTS